MSFVAELAGSKSAESEVKPADLGPLILSTLNRGSLELPYHPVIQGRAMNS